MSTGLEPFEIEQLRQPEVAYTEEPEQQQQEGGTAGTEKTKNDVVDGKKITTDVTETTGMMSGSGGSGSSDEFGTARTEWWGTSIVLISDVMGTGVLGLPYVATTLGWVSTMVALVVFAFFAAYAGYQLKSVRKVYPTILSYADAGTELVSPSFGTFTKICMLVNWGALAVYFLIATANGIADIYNEGFLACNVNRSWIAAVLLVVPAQSRDFHSISKYLAVPSTLAIIITILIILISMLLGNTESNTATTDNGTSTDTSNTDTSSTRNFGETTIVGVKPGTDAFDFLQSLSSIVFAFQGQSIFFELMSEMKEPKSFGNSLSSAYSFMLFCYTLTVVIAYGTEGTNVAGFLPDTLADGSPAKITVGIFVVFHIMVAYVIAVQPFHFWLHATIFPRTFNQPGRHGQIHWLVLTVGYIIFAFIVGNLIPFFADLQALIGALLGSPIVFGWPSLYYLLTNRNTQGSWKAAFSHMGIINSFLTLLMLCFITPLFLILGTWGSIDAIIADIADMGTPFQC